ncbi:MAG: hypothetical protein BGO27_04935 [Alphaproteobacteria bacterium 33-17]|nr:MAG: hypothetical protein BGO27_04935 [Alphaproteobacteria bacterium 33-17]
MKNLYKKLAVAIIFFIPIFVNSQFFDLISPIKFEKDLFQHYLVIIASSAIFWYSGWEFLEGFYHEMKRLSPGMMSLVGSAITITYVFSLLADFDIIEGKQYYFELSTMILVMLTGHIIESKSTLKAGDSINKLGDLLPSTANLIENDKISQVPIKSLKIGDVVLVKPGERIPIDGEIMDGSTTVNESLITGESKPVSKHVGSKVIGGCINDNGSIKIKVTNSASSTYISSIVNMLKDAQQTKSLTQDFADKGAGILTKVATSAGILTFIIWYFVIKSETYFAIERAISVFVVSCPHSLGLAIPIVIAIISSRAAKKGILIRNRKAFELLASSDVIVFDKTGTITTGEFDVTKIKAFNNSYSGEQVLSIIASLEAHSEHVIAKSIVKYASKNNIELLKANNFTALPGVGLKGDIDGESYYVTNMDYVLKNITGAKQLIATEVKTSGTYAFLSSDNQLIGALVLSDTIRPDATSVIASLKKLRIKPIMLTGDNEITANEIASQVGIESVFAGVSPKDKLNKIEELKTQGHIVAMIGDGINDAPALTQASVGIAIGAGTEVALESADIILVKSHLSDIITTINFAKAAHSKMRQNIYFAIGYNAIVIPLSSGLLVPYGIIISPLMATILNSLSDVVSIVNSSILRFKKF